MKTYARMQIGGGVEILRRVPHVVNAGEAELGAYAAAHGYKEFSAGGARPGRYYKLEYMEGPAEIIAVWTAWNLEDAKKDALETVQGRLDAVLDARATITCAGFEAGIVYDRNALINAGGLAEGDTFIDAADGLHTLTAEDVEAITAALKGKRKELYAATTQVRVRIDSAQDVDEVEAALDLAETL